MTRLSYCTTQLATLGYDYRLAPEVLEYALPFEQPPSALVASPPENCVWAVDNTLPAGLLGAMQRALRPGSVFWNEHGVRPAAACRLPPCCAPCLGANHLFALRADRSSGDSMTSTGPRPRTFHTSTRSRPYSNRCAHSPPPPARRTWPSLSSCTLCLGLLAAAGGPDDVGAAAGGGVRSRPRAKPGSGRGKLCGMVRFVTTFCHRMLPRRGHMCYLHR